MQIIFNMFRHRPSELFFQQAQARKVAVLARVPLASGLLTGKMSPNTTFAEDDHRNFNREGEAFDVGETFSGVDFETGLAAVKELEPLTPEGATMAQLALRWILMFDAVSTVIPGARKVGQVQDNVAAANLSPLLVSRWRPYAGFTILTSAIKYISVGEFSSRGIACL